MDNCDSLGCILWSGEGGMNFFRQVMSVNKNLGIREVAEYFVNPNLEDGHSTDRYETFGSCVGNGTKSRSMTSAEQ